MLPEEFQQLVRRRIALTGEGRDESLYLGVIIGAESGISAAARQVARVDEIGYRMGPWFCSTKDNNSVNTIPFMTNSSIRAVTNRIDCIIRLPPMNSRWNHSN